MNLVVDTEGPIPELVLFRRVARAWGLERTGARIVQRLRGLIPTSINKTTEGNTIFYWPAGSSPETWRKIRVANHEEHSRRNVGDVCLEEIACLVQHILHHSGGAPRQDIARSVCRLIGMARTPADAESRVNMAVNVLIANKRLADVGGYVRELSNG